jgi:hypothetical protein
MLNLCACRLFSIIRRPGFAFCPALHPPQRHPSYWCADEETGKKGPSYSIQNPHLRLHLEHGQYLWETSCSGESKHLLLNVHSILLACAFGKNHCFNFLIRSSCESFVYFMKTLFVSCMLIISLLASRHYQCFELLDIMLFYFNWH